jgi:hypothetical protein
VEREPVRRARADAGQPGQLRDEVLDRRAEHAAIVPVWIGPDVRRGSGWLSSPAVPPLQAPSRRRHS